MPSGSKNGLGNQVTKFAKFNFSYSTHSQEYSLRRIKKETHWLPSYPIQNISNQTKRGLIQ